MPKQTVAHCESVPFPPEKLYDLRSTQIHKNLPELLICSCVGGLLDTFAEALRYGAPSTLQELSLEDEPLLLRGLAEQYHVGVPGRAVVVVDVNRGLLGQLSRGGHNAGIFPMLQSTR